MIVWRSYDGRNLRMNQIENDHLVNIIYHIYQYHDRYSIAVLKEFQDEAKRRGITEKFKDRAQIPHKGKEGKWYMWNYETHQIEEV